MHKIFLLVVAALALAGVAYADTPLFTPTEGAKLNAAFDDLCPLILAEAALVAEIKEEQSNPTGVVDLKRLHDAGIELAQTRRELKALRKKNSEGLKIFRRVAHRDLDLKFCAEKAERDEASAGQ